VKEEEEEEVEEEMKYDVKVKKRDIKALAKEKRARTF
jgi:hypothetical protein